ncbi:hypothetical protein [Phycobacter azelaicus]|uniref:hypothetical protein n=1 Tax=Phycobacter azelaicus TaxID=2668075 RepID=UPI0018679FFC|nr:hypothetical protein [Phycobacter azelaicus]
MNLAITAVQWMIALAAAVLCVQIFAYAATSPSLLELLALSAILAAFYILPLVFFLHSLNKEIKWGIYLFAIYCIYLFVSTVMDGFTVENLIHFPSAILAFVAFCGIFHWKRDRKILEQQ